MHNWQLEEAGNHYGIFPGKFKVFPDLLEQSGYHIGYTGKGWGPGDWEAGGFTHNPAGPEYNEKVLVPPAQTGINKIDYSANFEDFLARRPEGAPFYFWYGGKEPHRQYVEGEGARSGKRLGDVVVPPYLPDDDVVKNDLLDYSYEIEWFDSHLGRMLGKLEEIGELNNTLIVVTSDNGMPFPRVKGQMYEQDFRLPMAICWKDAVQIGRIVEDLMSFCDLAPTFLEAAGLEIHSQVTGTSLMNVLISDKSGQVDPARNRVFLGRERHDLGREGDLGYPVRCIRTEQYLYVRNFRPERWPAGNPQTGFTNVDNSPSKSLILKQYYEEDNDVNFNLSFAKRPAEELYDIIDDPACMNNLAELSSFRELKDGLWNELKEKLTQTGDPRVWGNEEIFESYEYTGNAKNSWKNYLAGKNTNPSYPEIRGELKN
jgi:uncharacterized sulfatase